jgi:hypothetical protein
MEASYHNMYLGIWIRDSTMPQAGRWWVRFPMKSLGFLTQSSKAHYGPGVDLASKRKSVPGIFLENKARQARKAHNLSVTFEPIV